MGRAPALLRRRRRPQQSRADPQDRYGFSWQVYQTVLDTMLADADHERVQRVIACFMAVDKSALRIDELREAYYGALILRNPPDGPWCRGPRRA